MGYVYEIVEDGGGGGAETPSALNFSALPPASEEAGFLWFVENSQGLAWLPGSLGGTYYPRGSYYSNGTEWIYQENPGQATQAEANAGLISDKFIAPDTANNLSKWNTKENVLTAGTNITIDRTDPQNPVINSSGGGGGGETIVITNVPPTPADNVGAGYFLGQRWIDTSANRIYIFREEPGGVAFWEGVNYPPHFSYNSIKVVQSLADLPDPVGAEITLEDNTIYFIDSGFLDISGYTLVFNQRSQINGFGQNVSAIGSSTSGTVGDPYVFFKSGKNLFMSDLEIFCNGTNQLIWQHIGDGTVTEGESFELNRFNVLCFQPAGHNNQCGYIKDIRQGFVGTMSVIGLENGFITAGTWAGGFRVDNTIFINCSGVFFGSDPLDPVNFARRMSSNANITVPAGSIGYDFPETAFNFNGQYQLQNGNASGAGTYVSDFTSGFPAFDPIGNFQNNTGIQNTFPGGEWINNVDTITTITTANVWTPLSLTTINKSLTWFSELNGTFTYNSDTPLDVAIFLTVTLTGKANDVADVKLVKEDALGAQTDILTRRITIAGTTAQGRAESVPIISTDQLVEGDKIIPYVRNTSGTSDITTLIGSNCVINAK